MSPRLEFDDRLVNGRLLNADPSPDDPNDYPFEFDTAAPQPRRLLVSGLGPLLNQGNTGTCSVHGATGMRQWQEKRDGHGVIPVDVFRFYDLIKNVVDKQPDPARTIGTHIRSVLRFLKGTGTPLKGQSAPGAGGRIITYWRVEGEAAMKAALREHGPLLCRIDWDAAWMKLPFNKIMATPLGRIVGGHIFLVIGWDDAINGGSWAIRNSWGRWSFLGNGNGWLARRFTANRRFEAWAATDLIGD